jgi:hypothetical protein
MKEKETADLEGRSFDPENVSPDWQSHLQDIMPEEGEFGVENDPWIWVFESQRDALMSKSDGKFLGKDYKVTNIPTYDTVFSNLGQPLSAHQQLAREVLERFSPIEINELEHIHSLAVYGEGDQAFENPTIQNARYKVGQRIRNVLGTIGRDWEHIKPFLNEGRKNSWNAPLPHLRFKRVEGEGDREYFDRMDRKISTRDPSKPEAEARTWQFSTEKEVNEDRVRFASMTSKQFLDLAAEYTEDEWGHNQRWGSVNPDDYDKDTITFFKDRIREGKEMPWLLLDYDPIRNTVTSHEGRHRARAMYELMNGIDWDDEKKEWIKVEPMEGLDLVPVTIHLKPSDTRYGIEKAGKDYDASSPYGTGSTEYLEKNSLEGYENYFEDFMGNDFNWTQENKFVDEEKARERLERYMNNLQREANAEHMPFSNPRRAKGGAFLSKWINQNYFPSGSFVQVALTPDQDGDVRFTHGSEEGLTDEDLNTLDNSIWNHRNKVLWERANEKFNTFLENFPKAKEELDKHEQEIREWNEKRHEDIRTGRTPFLHRGTSFDDAQQIFRQKDWGVDSTGTEDYPDTISTKDRIIDVIDNLHLLDADGNFKDDHNTWGVDSTDIAEALGITEVSEKGDQERNRIRHEINRLLEQGLIKRSDRNEWRFELTDEGTERNHLYNYDKEFDKQHYKEGVRIYNPPLKRGRGSKATYPFISFSTSESIPLKADGSFNGGISLKFSSEVLRDNGYKQRNLIRMKDDPQRKAEYDKKFQQWLKRRDADSYEDALRDEPPSRWNVPDTDDRKGRVKNFDLRPVEYSFYPQKQQGKQDPDDRKEYVEHFNSPYKASMSDEMEVRLPQNFLFKNALEGITLDLSLQHNFWNIVDGLKLNFTDPMISEEFNELQNDWNARDDPEKIFNVLSNTMIHDTEKNEYKNMLLLIKEKLTEEWNLSGLFSDKDDHEYTEDKTIPISFNFRQILGDNQLYQDDGTSNIKTYEQLDKEFGLTQKDIRFNMDHKRRRR